LGPGRGPGLSMNPTSPIFFITKVLIARLHHQDVIALGVAPPSPSFDLRQPVRDSAHNLSRWRGIEVAYEE
jgi:hypothetical protein